MIGAVRDSGGSGHSLLSDGYSEHQFPDLPERNHDWIALVIRGNCTFVQKTRVAARAGAEGLLVVDSEIRSAHACDICTCCLQLLQFEHGNLGASPFHSWWWRRRLFFQLFAL